MTTNASVLELRPRRPRHEIVNANVRAEMGRAHITQTGLAQALGMSQQAVSDRMSGKTKWDVDLVDEVAAVFGLDASDLMVEIRSGAPRPVRPAQGDAPVTERNPARNRHPLALVA